MTNAPGYYDHLSFNAPLSDARAAALGVRLARARPATILDLGCGWGELLLRLLGSCAAATGRGVDTDGRLVERARAAAAERGLAERVAFATASAAAEAEPADLVLCIGSGHALADNLPETLAALRDHTRPGGRVLLGEGFWEPRGPVDRSLVYDDLLAMPDLAGLTEASIEAGLRPLWIETANADEWATFESGYLADDEEWLHEHHGHADAERVRAGADEHRTAWLRGYQHGLGFAYLTLGRVD